MAYYDVHVCMVSNQLLPNLIPLFDEATRPREVVLLISADMTERAELLKRNIERLGCSVSSIEGISPYDVGQIRDQVLEVVSERENESIALNATGGTKVMALGACDVFRETEKPAFYVDTESGHFISLLPSPRTEPLADSVRVKTYLAAYGYEIRGYGNAQVPSNHQDLTRYLVTNAGRLEQAITILNGCAAGAERTLMAHLEPRHLEFAELMELLGQFSAAGLLGRDEQRLVFHDEAARVFSNGGWLEEHVLAVVNRLKGEGIIRDHLCNLKVESLGGVKNEIDLAFTARNRLHLLECKTGGFRERMSGQSRADGVAYKLDAIRNLMGGTYGKAMLVTFRRLTPEDRKRCEDYRIRVVEGGRIVELPALLRRWIEGGAG